MHSQISLLLWRRRLQKLHVGHYDEKQCAQGLTSSRSMPLSLGVFLECIGNTDCSIAQVLAIHGLNGSITGIKGCKINKGEPFGIARLKVSHDLESRKEQHNRSRSFLQRNVISKSKSTNSVYTTLSLSCAWSSAGNYTAGTGNSKHCTRSEKSISTISTGKLPLDVQA